MPWNSDGWRWDCEVCDQVVEKAGPWCSLYVRERAVCRPVVKAMLEEADANGDGPLVNALCDLGRRRWGEDRDW